MSPKNGSVARDRTCRSNGWAVLDRGGQLAGDAAAVACLTEELAVLYRDLSTEEHLVRPGDLVIIMTYVQDDNADLDWQPRVVLVDAQNRITEVRDMPRQGWPGAALDLPALSMDSAERPG